MKTFTVRITEIREKCMTVETETFEDAIELVKELYSNRDIQLDNDDISDVEFD